jgi:dihydroflavonol-4-reductase
VRTTVRDLAREPQVRAAIGSEVADAGPMALEFFAADLGGDEGWPEAAQGCDHVLHVASPFPPSQPKDPDELIVPARDGTLRVLRAGLEAGAARIVVTSSVAAVGGGAQPSPTPLTEEDWTDLDNPKLSPYVRSKTIAERAAWDLAREEGALDRVSFVNPGAILGPALSDDRSFSLEMVERLLKGIPGVPRIGFNIVDVRDVVDLQIRAMTAPAAAGERFIAVGRFAWMSEVADVLRENLGAAAEKVPRRKVPDLLVRAMAIFDPASARSSDSSARSSSTRAERPNRGSAGRRARSTRRSSTAAAAWSRRLLRRDENFLIRR